MKPLGEVNLRVIHGRQNQVLKFQVVSGTKKLSLCPKTCQKLGLLKLETHAEVLTMNVKEVPVTAKSIFQGYQDVFKGLEHIGTSNFVLDPSAEPVGHTSRCIPVALKDEVKAKLKDPERKGFIVKDTSPTEWIKQYGCGGWAEQDPHLIRPQELNKVRVSKISNAYA